MYRIPKVLNSAVRVRRIISHARHSETQSKPVSDTNEQQTIALPELSQNIKISLQRWFFREIFSSKVSTVTLECLTENTAVSLFIVNRKAQACWQKKK